LLCAENATEEDLNNYKKSLERKLLGFVCDSRPAIVVVGNKQEDIALEIHKMAYQMLN